MLLLAMPLIWPGDKVSGACMARAMNELMFLVELPAGGLMTPTMPAEQWLFGLDCEQ